MPQTSHLRVVVENTAEPAAAAPDVAGVPRLGDIRRSGAVFRVCCGTCHHVADVAPHSLGLPDDLPVAEVKRGLSCSACGGRWVDVAEAQPRVELRLVSAAR